MTKEQINYIDYCVGLNSNILKDIKSTNFNKLNSEQYNKLKIETKKRLINILETAILRPEESIKPVKKTFKPEDDVIRIEIRNQVNELFNLI